MIIKAFKRQGLGFFGQDIESWTKNWGRAEGMSEKFSQSAASDHLSPFFKRYFPLPPKKILDGGCGMGKHTIAYRNMGYDITGVDFSGGMIRSIKNSLGEGFPVYEADVTALPFEDGRFDCCYSGGVMEHFEEGPARPLKEARRVLKKGGRLLATVPYVNLLRRLSFLVFSAKETGGVLQRKVDGCSAEPEVSETYRFHQYLFDAGSLAPYFKDNGFSIEGAHPMDLLWGEVGLALQKFIVKRRDDKSPSPNPDKDAAVKDLTKKRSLIKTLAYDFFVTENRDNIFFALPLAALNFLSGHMILFVARAI